MTPADQKDINLLPKELAAKKKAVHRDAASLLVEYTDFANRGETGADPGKQKTPSFFSRLFSVFSRKKKTEAPKLAFKSSPAPPVKKDGEGKHALPDRSRLKDLPQGKMLPSALFAGAAKKPAPQAPAPPVPFREPGVTAEHVMSMHVPDFLDNQELLPHAAASAPAILTKQQSALRSSAPARSPAPPKSIPWWARWFLRKKEPAKQVAFPKPVPSSLPQAGSIKQEPAPRPVPAIKEALPAPTIASMVAKKTGASGQTEAPVHRASGFDVNLLAAEYTQAFKKGNPLAVLLSWAAVAVLALGVAYGLLELYQVRGSRRLAQEAQVVRALKETIATYQDLSSEDSVLYRKAAATRELLGNHLSWHAFLGKLEEVTIPEITYISMAASTEGIMNITAFAGDYTGLARQIVVFQQTPWIKDITITSASRVEESPTQAAGVSFDISLSISPDALFADTRYE